MKKKVYSGGEVKTIVYKEGKKETKNEKMEYLKKPTKKKRY